MGPATARMLQALFNAPEVSDLTIGFAGIGFLLLFSILNSFSISISARIQFIMVLVMVIVGIATALWFFGSGNWTAANASPFFTTGGSGFVIAIGIMMVMVIGFDCIPQLAEEADYPKKNMLWIMLAAVVISECIFAIICLANAGMKPTSWIMEQIVVSPEIARQMGGNIPAAIMNIAGLAATLTCLNGFMVAAARVVFAMGRARVLPPFFARTNKYDIPHVAIWSVFVICSLMVLIGGEGWLETLFIASAFTTGIVYALTSLSAAVLRKKHPEWPRPVKMPGGIPMAVIATIIGVGIVITVAFGMPVRAWIILAVWIVIGLIVFTWMGSIRKKDENYREIWMTPDDIEDDEPMTSSE
jgi:APA family basic amino acid/polyamine antiporter